MVSASSAAPASTTTLLLPPRVTSEEMGLSMITADTDEGIELIVVGPPPVILIASAETETEPPAGSISTDALAVPVGPNAPSTFNFFMMASTPVLSNALQEDSRLPLSSERLRSYTAMRSSQMGTCSDRVSKRRGDHECLECLS